jgi:hypothetical protein
VRVNVQHNGVIHDVGTRSTHLVRKRNDGISDLFEVGELLSLDLLRELSPWLGSVGLMIEAQLEGASCD